MKRAEMLFQQIEAEIMSGNYGASGGEFPSVRELAKRHACSLRCALDVRNLLLKSRILRKYGKHCYIVKGVCSPDSAYGKLLFDAGRPLFGVLVKDNSNPFYGALLDHLRGILHGQGMNMVVSCSGSDPQKTAEIMDLFVELKCKGVFTCVTLQPMQEMLFSRYPLPIVSLAEDSGIPSIDAILVDNYAAGAQVAKHLVEQGSKSFAYITLDDYVQSDQRLKGFRDHLNRNEFTLPEESIGIVSANDDVARANQLKSFVSGLLDKASKAPSLLPLSIFCVHDLLAADVMRVVKRYSGRGGRKFQIPTDVRIVGFDDLPIASQHFIPISTISYQYSGISRKAFEVMMDRLTNPQHVSQHYEIPSVLVVRESTKTFAERSVPER